MSIHGFLDQNGQVQKYDYDDLDNKPTIPTQVVIDDTLTQQGQAADAKAVGDVLQNLDSGLSEIAKTALLNCFANVAWINSDGQTYYDALEAALERAEIYTITNTLMGCTTSNDATTVYEGRSYIATITASSGYTLTGATVSITMGGTSVTGYYNNGTISIPNVTGNLVITVTATSEVSSISAVFTQGANVIYDTDSLDTLRQYLVVTATYADTTTGTVTDYTLSGTLASGTQTITAAYGGKTDTFTVNVTLNGWLYHFNESILSSGSHDFGLTGVENYANGVNTGDKCYYHHVATEGDASTDPLGLYALASIDYPTWDNKDFTIATWAKGDTPKRGWFFAASKMTGTTAFEWSASASNIKSGWSVARAKANKKYAGIRIGMVEQKFYISLSNSAGTSGAVYNITVPSGFDTTQWHHYALTRSGTTLYYFIDGNLIFNIVLSASTSLYSSNTISIGNVINESSSTPAIVNYPYSTYHQDLYVAVGFAKWTSDFDPTIIIY